MIFSNQQIEDTEFIIMEDERNQQKLAFKKSQFIFDTSDE